MCIRQLGWIATLHHDRVETAAFGWSIAVSLTLTYYGYNYVDYYNGEYANNDTLPEVAATGANSVALTPDFGIDVASSTIYAGGDTTDTVADLTTAIDEASENGMTAFVRPLVDILYPQASAKDPGTYYVPDSFYAYGYADSGYNPAVDTTYAGDTPAGVTPATVPANADNLVNYRGELAFTNEGGDLNATKFFGSPTIAGSYDYVIVDEAKAAQAAGAKLFSIGTELDELADDTSSAVKADWDNLIADVRAVFSGALTYSANWATASQVTFWNKLDYVGIDGYVPLSNTIPSNAAQNPSLASLIAGWNTPSNVDIAYSGGVTVSQQLGGVSAIDAFDQLAQQSINKGFIFTELGYQNDTGAAADPTGGSNQGVADPSLQAELYSAFFDAWGGAQQSAAANGGLVDGTPYSLVGAYFWNWNPDTSPAGYDDWSVYGYPAESVIATDFEANETACYCRGTLILTDRGEAPVETLRIGDRVVTLSGEAKPIKWIGQRSYSGRFVAGNRDVLPVCIAAEAFVAGVPSRDLWVSPEHALYLKGVLIPARHLINGKTIIQPDEANPVEYFHIELARHDVIFADGAAAETFVDDDTRSMFHNAAEYHTLYREPAHAIPAAYCAPRVEDGLALEVLRHELLVRARHLGDDGRQMRTKSLRGRVDRVTHQRIEGWAFDPASPETPVAVEVLANGVEIARIVADRYRADLNEAGIGDGRHAFELVVPGGLARDVRMEIELGFEADRTALPGSPVVLDAVTASQPGSP
jgi:hypothetical protein